MKEDNFINLIKKILPESSMYIGDDSAYISEKDLILTQDTLVEDVHFRSSTISSYDLGIKSIAVNLSDIAASGGIPKYILISLSMPENIDYDFIKSFYEGVRNICQKHNVLVVGGDLTRAPKIMISIAIIGFGDGIVSAKRSNAKIGELVIATGEFGSSGAGLWLLETQLKSPELITHISENIKDKFIKAHINPIPRLKEGRSIVESCEVSPALMDTSDGLADALYKICFQSNVSIEINYKDIPVDKNLEFTAGIANISPDKWIFYGGEDYQLIGTVPEKCLKKLQSQNIDIKIIGKVIKSDNNPAVYIKLNDKITIINSETLNSQLFGHFK